MTLKDSVNFGERKRELWPGGERRTKSLMWVGDTEGAEANGEFPKSVKIV